MKIKKNLYILIITLLAISTVQTIAEVVDVIHNQGLNPDYFAYYDQTQLIVEGQNPYDPSNLRLLDLEKAPIVFPGYVAVFLPHLLFNVHITKYLFLIFNLLAGPLVLILLLRRTNLFEKINLADPNAGTVLLIASFYLYLNSSPYIFTLLNGQSTFLIAVCFMLMLFAKSFPVQSAAFAVSAVLKYSLLPFYGLILLFKRKYVFCLVSFTLFALCALSPALFGHDLKELYTAYYANVISWCTGDGYNTFPVYGYAQLQAEFFKSGILNILIKLLVLTTAIWAVYRERQSRRLGLKLLLLIGCATMVISYHRIYDLVLVIPLMLVFWLSFYKQKQFAHFSITGIFLLWLLLPRHLVLKLGNAIGSLFQNNSVIHLPQYVGELNNLTHIFPIYAVMMLLLTFYSAYLYFKADDVPDVSIYDWGRDE
ncbi:glycosyltransferase family 87 protein [Candidatus Margulisiibacteriota bacterium]